MSLSLPLAALVIISLLLIAAYGIKLALNKEQSYTVGIIALSSLIGISSICLFGTAAASVFILSALACFGLSLYVTFAPAAQQSQQHFAH